MWLCIDGTTCCVPCAVILCTLRTDRNARAFHRDGSDVNVVRSSDDGGSGAVTVFTVSFKDTHEARRMIAWCK